MLFIIFSYIKINCVIFAKMDQVFSLKNKTLKKYCKNGKKTLDATYLPSTFPPL